MFEKKQRSFGVEKLTGFAVYKYDEHGRVSSLRIYGQDMKESLSAEMSYYYQENEEEPYKIVNLSMPDKPLNEEKADRQEFASQMSAS